MTAGFIPVVILILTPASDAKTTEIVSAWDSLHISVDGKSLDWPDNPGAFFPEQNASLAACNDGNFLYLIFRTTDARWCRAIKATGITFYIDTEGGKKKDFFIKFKGGPSREQLMSFSRNRDDRMPGDVDKKYPGPHEDAPTELTCFIKDRIVEKTVPLDGNEGPSAAFDTSQGFFTYEFGIPLAAGSVRYFGLGTQPGKEIGVGVVWGDMSGFMGKRGEGHPEMGGQGGGFPGGMGRPGGMGGQGGMEGSGGKRPEKPEKQELWLKAVLSEPPNPDLKGDHGE
jgi:hypothetical protein